MITLRSTITSGLPVIDAADFGPQQLSLLSRWSSLSGGIFSEQVLAYRQLKQVIGHRSDVLHERRDL